MDLDEAVHFVQQKISDPGMLSFNINSLFSTFYHLVDLQGWKRPEELADVLHSIIRPLFEEGASLEAYTPQVSSNIRMMVEYLLEQHVVVERLGNEIYRELLTLLRQYCRICNQFIVNEEMLTLHMAQKHSLPPHLSYTQLNSQFLYRLQTQCVHEYHELCPRESFYTSR